MNNTFNCDMCQQIENYDDRFCFNGQDLCIDCYSRDDEKDPNCFIEQPKVTVLNCLTFIIDRIIDEETNAIKENECPICMEQMTEDGYKIGENCDHKTCDNCFCELITTTNKCCICRAVLEGEEMPGLTNDDSSDEEAEEYLECQLCGSSNENVRWRAHSAQIWCNSCEEGQIECHLCENWCWGDENGGVCGDCRSNLCCERCEISADWTEELGIAICVPCYNNDVENGTIENASLRCLKCGKDDAILRPESNNQILCNPCENVERLMRQ